MSKIFYNRRNFVKLSAGAAIGGAAMLSGLTFPNEVSGQNPFNGRPVRLGFVGIGGRGSYHLNAALGIEGVEVPAICEVIPKRLQQAKKWCGRCGCCG